MPWAVGVMMYHHPSCADFWQQLLIEERMAECMKSHIDFQNFGKNWCQQPVYVTQCNPRWDDLMPLTTYMATFESIT